MKIENIYRFLDKLAPFETALSFDNCGLLIGDMQGEVTSCVLALDMTKAVLEYAKEVGAKLIITHHPVIFDPLKKVWSDNIVFDIIGAKISIISAHTNLDLSEWGVNSALADRLLLTDIAPFENEDNIGKVGKLPHKMNACELADFIKERLNSPCVSYVDLKNDRLLETIACIGGEGSDYLYAAQKYDAFITGEVKHHVFSYAQNAGIQLFTAGHYETEAVVLEPLKAILQAEFETVSFAVYAKSDVVSL